MFSFKRKLEWKFCSKTYTWFLTSELPHFVSKITFESDLYYVTVLNIKYEKYFTSIVDAKKHVEEILGLEEIFNPKDRILQFRWKKDSEEAYSLLNNNDIVVYSIFYNLNNKWSISSHYKYFPQVIEEKSNLEEAVIFAEKSIGLI